MKLLEMSISAGILILLLVMLRSIGLFRLPKRVTVLLWTVVMLRLMLPASLPLPGGIATPAVRLLQQALRGMERQDMDPDGIKGTAAGTGLEAASSRGYGGIALESRIAASNRKGFGIPVQWFWIWMSGAAVLAVYFALSYRKEYGMLSQAIPLEPLPAAQQEIYQSAYRVAGMRCCEKQNRVYTHDRIASPLVWGIVRQKIVLPKGMVHMEPGQMKYILAHEMVHMNRRDNFWKLVSAAVLCIHWFNPMVWAMYYLFAKDLELSCDEEVIALYGSSRRKEYAMALLMFAQNQKEATLFYSGFGKNLAKERIVAIMKYKKLSKIGAASAVMLLAGAVTVFAANDKEEASKSLQPAEGQQSESEIIVHDTTGLPSESGKQEKVPSNDRKQEELSESAKLIQGQGNESEIVVYDTDSLPSESGGQVKVTVHEMTGQEAGCNLSDEAKKAIEEMIEAPGKKSAKKLAESMSGLSESAHCMLFVKNGIVKDGETQDGYYFVSQEGQLDETE